MGVKVKSSYQEEDEEKKQAQQAIKTEPEPAKAEMPAPAPASVVNTGSRGIPKLNRAQRTTIGQNHALRYTDFTIETPSALENLPEALEPRRAEYEQKEREGKLAGSASHNWGTRQISVEIGSIKDERQLAYFTSTLETDRDKTAVMTAWAEENGLSADDVIFHCEEMLGDKLFSEPQTAQGGLNKIGLVDLNGEALDLRTADFASVVNAAQSIPDKTIRKQAFEHIEKMTKTYGGRFFGQSLDGVSTDFRDSLDFSQADYDDFVDGLGNQFYAADGHEEENLRRYMAQYEAINGESSLLSGAQKRWYTKALEDAFVQQMGYGSMAPDVQKARAVLDQLDAARAAQVTGQGELEEDDEPGLIRGALNAVKEFAAGLFGGEEPPAEPKAMPTPAPVSTPSPMSGMKAEELPVTLVASAGPAPVTAGRAAFRKDDEDSDEQREMPKVQGPAYEPQDGAQTAPAAGTVNLTGDMATALEYAHTGRIDELDEATQEMLRGFEAKGGAGRRALLRVVTPEFYQKVQAGNEGADYLWLEEMGNQLGSQLGSYALRIYDPSFPKELYGDAVMAIDEIISAAEREQLTKAELQDAGGNRIVAYLAKHQDALSGVDAVFHEIDGIREDGEAYAAEVAAEADAELERARQAVAIGQASTAQRQLVLENAPQMDNVMAMRDPTYADMYQQVSDYFYDAAGNWGEDSPAWMDSWVYKTMKANGVQDLEDGESEYELLLYGTMDSMLMGDMRMAAAVGQDLETYYKAQGGMSMDMLAQRASAEIIRRGSQTSAEEVAAVQETVAGEADKAGLGMGKTLGLTAKVSSNTIKEGRYESFLMVAAATDIPRDVARITADFNRQYGAFFGPAAYKKVMYAYANSGKLPKELSEHIIGYLDEGGDPYQLGIHPEDNEWAVSGYAQTQERAATYQKMIAAQATEGEAKFIQYGSGVLQDAQLIAETTGLALLLSPFGAAGQYAAIRTVYGSMNQGKAMSDYMSQGYRLAEALTLSQMQVAGEALANVATLGHLTDRLYGYSSLLNKGLTALGGVSNPKVASAFITGVKSFFSEIAEETVKDPLLEGTFSTALVGAAKDAMDGGFNPIRNIVAGVSDAAAGLPETVSTMIDEAPQTIMATIPFALLGAGGEVLKNSNSVKAVETFVENPTAENAKAVEAAIAEDAKDERWINALAQEERKAEIETEAAANLMFAPDEQLYKNAQKTREQADSHKKQAEASRKRIEEGWKHYDAHKADGDIQTAVEALDDISKAEQGLEEHTREYEQKSLEAREAERELVQDAHDRAVADVNARHMRLNEEARQEAEAREAERQKPEARMAEIEGKLESVQEQIVAADDAGEEARAAELMARQDELLAQMESIGAEMEQSEAVQEARSAAESALAAKEEEAAAAMQQAAENEKIAEEKAAMTPVYKDLRTRPVYIDKQQAAEIKSMTGLTVSQFNRKYGMNLTTNKEKAGRNSLDGSFFADLAEQAPGYIDAETTHPEEAIVRLAERKKELAQMQASFGDTSAEAYVTDVTRGADDPVTQQIASELKKNTDIDLVTANLEDGLRGWYDRKHNQLVLSNRLGAGETRRVVAMHELTHYIERSPGYEAYKKAVLEAAYEGGEEYRAQMLERDRGDIREEYAKHGVALTPDDVDAELVAAATERVIGGDEAFFEHLISGGKRSLVQRVYMKIRNFLARRKAKKASKEMLAQYDAMAKARDLMEKALKAAPRGEDANGKTQYAIMRDESGRSVVVVEDDILSGVPQKEWAKIVKQVLKTKFPNGVTVGNNQIQITGKSRNEITNSKDTMWLKRNESAAYANKLRAANNADEILQASTDYVNEAPKHERRDDIVDFGRGNVQIMVGGQMYDAEVIVGSKKDGSMILYDFVEMTKKEETQRTAGRQSAPHDSRAASLSNISVHQNAPDVKNQSMQGNVQKSIGIRQFGNNSAQRADFISDEVKAIVKDTTYERDTNRAQVTRARERMDAMGGADTAAAMLLCKDKKSYTADDNALAFVAMAEATRNGDNTTAAMLAKRMNEETGEQGRALQSVQIAGKLTAAGAMAETIRKADRANAAHGVPEGSFPIGEGEPKKGGTESSKDGRTTAKTPEAVEQVYRTADEVNAALDMLPGDISYDNPWALPLSDRQMELIRKYRLTGEKLPGAAYNVATVKQRMLSAIIAAGPETAGNGQKALCQQLEAMKRGHAVVTKADLNYTASQMAEYRLLEGEATTPTTQAGRLALSRAYQAQDNVTQEGFFSKWSALRFMNMLSAPATAVRNVSSNVLASGLENAATVVATAMDAKVGKKTGNRTTTLASKSEKRAGKKAFAAETAQTFEDYFITHADTGHGHKYAAGGQGRVFESEFLEGCRNLVDFAMQIGDRPFYEKTYAQELAIIKRLGMKATEMQDGRLVSRPMTDAEMHAEATARALKRVFQEDNQIVDALNSIKAKSPEADLFISTLMPFIKTPTNIAMRAIEYSPVGLGITLTRRMMHGIDSGKKQSISQRDYVMGIGRGLTGSMLIAAGYALAACGTIGFGRSDEENDRRSGILSVLGEPYSMYIRIGDTKHEIDWALPMSSAIAMGAELYKNLDDGEGLLDAVGSALINGVGEQIMSTPMLSAMNDIFRGYDDTENTVMRLAKTGVTSLINQTLSPAVIRAIAKVTDPYVRDTSSSSGVWAALNQNLIQYWPGLRQMLPIKTDLTGDKQLQSGYWNPKGEHGSMMLQMLDSFLTPTATIGEKNDPELLELLDLSYRTDESAFLPTDLISKNKYELKLNKEYAKALGYAEAAITMEMTDEEKRGANSAFGNLLFNGSGNIQYLDKLGMPVTFPGLRAVMEDRARYESGKYRQEKAWGAMTDEERVALVTRMRDDAKGLIAMNVARRKKEDGEI